MKKIDIVLLAIVIMLTLFGLVMIYEASSFIAFKDFGDKYRYIKDQTLWAILGFVGLTFFSYFDYKKLYNFSLLLLIGAIIMLIMVFIPGMGVLLLGARRWINLRFFLLQPAEFVKLALTIYLAAWFTTKEKGRLLAFSMLMGIVLFLIMAEPDMGTAGIILFEAIFIYFLSGGSIGHFLLLIPVVAFGGFMLIILEPYRMSRLVAFLNVGKSLDGSSYHVKQILIAFGMGGITGVGFGNSLQKYAYLPENTTDSIFAIIAEEIGLLGSLILIIFFVLFVWRGFSIAIRCQDKFGKLLAGGITSFLAVQMLINLGAQTALLPLTGVPLPFISYGGSALIVDLCSVGILLNISRRVG